MDINEFNEIANQLLGDEVPDLATRTSVLNQIREGLEKEITDKTTAQTEVESLIAQNKRLSETNLNLFDRLGTQAIEKTGGTQKEKEQERATTITPAQLMQELLDKK